MELKVWVDGIQRVVCGASYNTTCQDVVIALASAMGRTGRFTLVEKWRDSERPLFPRECPLQSLHKWGEYAAEVKFYLVQAAAVSAKEGEGNQQKWQAQSLKVSDFSPLLSSQNHVGTQEAESLKRSSTFSGAHRTNCTPSLSMPSSYKSSALLNSKNNQQNTVPTPTPLARGQLAGTASIPNGDVFRETSSKSPSKLFSGVSSSGLQPALPDKSNFRQLHPAGMSAVLSSGYAQITDYPSDSSFKQSAVMSPKSAVMSPKSAVMSPKSAAMLSSQPPAKSVYPRYSQKLPSSSLALTHQVAPKYQNTLDTAASKFVFPSPQLQSSFPSFPFHPHDDIPQHEQQQQHHLKPSSHFHLTPLSAEHDKIPHHPRRRPKHPEQRERSQDRNVHQSLSSPGDLNHAKTNFNNNNHHHHRAEMETNVYGRHYDNELYNNINTTRDVNPLVHNGRALHGISSSYISASQKMATSKDSFQAQYPSRTKSSTLDRRTAQSKAADELPSRSFSTGDPGHDYITDQAGNLQPEFVANQQKPTRGAGNKFTFVDSALMKHQKPNTDGGNSKALSFSSAVGNVRTQGDIYLKNSKTETNTRQHMLKNTKESSGEKNIQNNMSLPGRHSLGEFNSKTDAMNADQQHALDPLETNSKTAAHITSISSSEQNSAFTRVSPKPSQQETSLSATYNFSSIHGFSSHNQAHDVFNSSQTSLEVEEYDLDRNFPDVLHREAAGAGGVQGVTRPSLSSEYVEGGVNQSERDYLRLLRLVSVQQERIQTQEALISEASMEIAALEEEESSKLAQLDLLAKDISHLEKQEMQLQQELEELVKVNWAGVLEEEQKREANDNLQVKSLKEQLEKIEQQIKQLSEEADQKSRDLSAEEEQINQEKKKNEELESKTVSEIAKLKDQISDLHKTTEDSGKKLKDVEQKMLDADVQLKQQEEMANSIQEKLKGQVFASSLSKPTHKEACSNPAVVLDAGTSGPVNTLSTTDSGEAVLKILEGRLSPRSPENHGDTYGGVFSAQHLFQSAMSVKNPHGVWV